MNKFKIISIIGFITLVIVPAILLAQAPPPPPPPPDPSITPFGTNLFALVAIAVYYGVKRINISPSK